MLGAEMLRLQTLLIRWITWIHSLAAVKLKFSKLSILILSTKDALQIGPFIRGANSTWRRCFILLIDVFIEVAYRWTATSGSSEAHIYISIQGCFFVVRTETNCRFAKNNFSHGFANLLNRIIFNEKPESDQTYQSALD